MLAKDYRLKARESLAGNWMLSVLVALLAAILGGLASNGMFSVNFQLGNESGIEIIDYANTVLRLASFLAIVQFIVGGPIRLGHCRYLLNQQDRQTLSAQDLFTGFQHFGAGFLLQLLISLFTFLWSLLLIIPGIVASYRYAMAPFIMAEHPEMSAIEAINASKKMMYGNKWRLFCLDFSFIGWAILCAFTFGIGMLFLNPYITAARAAFYRSLNKTDS